jgi:hypothetical protein
LATGTFATGDFAGEALGAAVLAVGLVTGFEGFAEAFAGVFVVFLLGIVLLLVFETVADARASFLDALRVSASVFLVPLSLEPLSFVLEFFL